VPPVLDVLKKLRKMLSVVNGCPTPPKMALRVKPTSRFSVSWKVTFSALINGRGGYKCPDNFPMSICVLI
jgi:hypothetical protein